MLNGVQIQSFPMLSAQLRFGNSDVPVLLLDIQSHNEQLSNGKKGGPTSKRHCDALSQVMAMLLCSAGFLSVTLFILVARPPKKPIDTCSGTS